MNLSFASEQIFNKFVTRVYHPKLAEFLWWWCDQFYEAVITSCWRSDGVHSTGRAVDLRSYIYSNPEGMAKLVNAEWEYDPKRPGKYDVVYYHGPPNHFHIQVHDRTTYGRNP